MKILVVFSFFLFVAGCSFINPYEERGYCDAKQVQGYCGTMSDVYNKIKEGEK